MIYAAATVMVSIYTTAMIYTTAIAGHDLYHSYCGATITSAPILFMVVKSSCSAR